MSGYVTNNPRELKDAILRRLGAPVINVEVTEDQIYDCIQRALELYGEYHFDGVNKGYKVFKDKRDMKDAGYKDSRLWLNKDLARYDRWGKNEIEKRFDILSKRFLEIWQFPQLNNFVEDTNGEVNIFDADEPKHKKLEYAIFFDQKLNISQVSKLYSVVLQQLFDLQPETFFTTDLAEKLNLTKKPSEKGIRQAIQLNENYYIEGNIDNIGKFEKIKHALTVYGFEDELIIKYQEDK